MGEGLIGSVAKTRRAILISDATNDPRVVQHDDPALHLRSIIVAPVLFKDRLIAVLAVVNPADGLSFTDTDFSLVESLAEQVGLAVHNSDSLKLQLEKNKLDLDIELASNIKTCCCRPPSPLQTHWNLPHTTLQRKKSAATSTTSFRSMTIRSALSSQMSPAKASPHPWSWQFAKPTYATYHAMKNRPPKCSRQSTARCNVAMRRDMFITMTYAIIDTEAGTSYPGSGRSRACCYCTTDRKPKRFDLPAWRSVWCQPKYLTPISEYQTSALSKATADTTPTA